MHRQRTHDERLAEQRERDQRLGEAVRAYAGVAGLLAAFAAIPLAWEFLDRGWLTLAVWLLAMWVITRA